MQSFDPKQPLRGFKVLVPRGGNFGADIAEEVRLRGAFPVMAPLINFATPCGEDFDALVNAFSSLEAGHYNWLVVTHQTTVDVIYSMNVKIPPGTLVAASGRQPPMFYALLDIGLIFPQCIIIPLGGFCWSGQVFATIKI